MEFFKDHDRKEEDPWDQFIMSPTFKGGVIGAIITAFVSWNRGRNGKIGNFMARWRFIRYMVSPKPIKALCPITNYHHPNLNIAVNNFYCYSGQSGIGVSRHFQSLTSMESYRRPTLYLSFKAVGREANFQNDLTDQLNYGQGVGRGGIVGEIVKAIKQIHEINQDPQKYLSKYYLANLAMLGLYGIIFVFSIPIQIQFAIFAPLFLFHCQYLYFMKPLVVQARRASIPILVFDDLNKLEHLGLLAEITRFFKVIEAKSANIMLISTTEEIWSKLRREPGMKDRLRVRHILYDYAETASRLVDMIERDPVFVRRFFNTHPLISHDVLKEIARTMIGESQMTIRRFSSVLKLADEEEYQKLVQILQNQKHLTIEQMVLAMRGVIFQSEKQTMVTNFRSIKRELQSMSMRQYLDTLEMAVRHKKLPSDCKVGPLLRVYNILRDVRSEYVINGGYILKIFQLALEQYKQEWHEYEVPVYLRDDE